MGFDTFNIGPELEYFLFEDNKGTVTLDEGGYFAMTRSTRRPSCATRRSRRSRRSGIPIEYHHHEVAPSQHEIDMRYAHALEMADHDAHLPADREGDRGEGTAYYATFMPKPLFGENGSGMHTHMSLFTDGRNQFFDARRPEPPLADGEGVHRRAAPPRARAVGGLRAVGQLVQAARAGLRGAGVRRLVAAQPLGADPDPALQAGLRAGDARRDPLPRPGLQPVPDLRGAAARGARGDRAGLRARGADGLEPLPPLRRRAARSAGSSRCPARSARRSRSSPSSELMKRALGEHIYSPLRRAEAQGVGRVPDPADAVGARPLPGGALDMDCWKPGRRRILGVGLRRKASAAALTDGRSRAPSGSPWSFTAPGVRPATLCALARPCRRSRGTC